MSFNLWGINMGYKFHMGHISTNRSSSYLIFVDGFHINKARMTDA